MKNQIMFAMLLISLWSSFGSAAYVSIQVSEAGQPIPGALVTLTTPDQQEVTTTTDEAGVAHPNGNFPSGAYTVSASYENGNKYVFEGFEFGSATEYLTYQLDVQTAAPTDDEFNQLYAQLSALAETISEQFVNVLFSTEGAPGEPAQELPRVPTNDEVPTTAPVTTSPSNLTTSLYQGYACYGGVLIYGGVGRESAESCAATCDYFQGSCCQWAGLNGGGDTGECYVFGGGSILYSEPAWWGGIPQ